MKLKLLFLCSVFSIALANAQCSTIPLPPGLHAVYALDTDNDGIATFDMAYFIANHYRPFYENQFNVTSVGYDCRFINSAGDDLPLMYTNSPTDENLVILMTYNGNGPEFQPQPPCFYPVEWILNSGVVLRPVPFNQDMDEDGILNIDEDSNHNLNLMDDDDDQDGIINLKDDFNNLANVEYLDIQLKIYPNPVNNGSFTFESNTEISNVIIYDLTGKNLFESKANSNQVNVSAIASGLYLVEFQSEKGIARKKITIN